MVDRVGQQLGNYRLLRLIGRGSIAEVYLGEHLHLGTQAAIKVLHTQLTSEASEQLRTEAHTMARLTHPHIVRTLDFDVEDGVPFLIMEYAPNGTLRQRHPKSTQVPLDAIVSYVRQVAEALHYIHQQKLIHRDVKPENMLLGHNNEVLLTEFNSAIIIQSTRSQPTAEAAGTVAYMAPEQLRGKPRPASDQYALGVVVYEWLSGNPPFQGSIREIANQHLSAPPPLLHARIPAISSAIEHVVLKALAKDPQQRFEHVQAFALALEEACQSPARTNIAPSSESLTGSGQSKSPPRKLPTGTITLLFTNIAGSTRLLQQLGDRYAGVLAECRRLLHATFQEWNGHEVDTQGDSLFVAFARATDAVLAVIEAQRALAAHPWPEGVAVRVRMGLHTGEPALTPEGYAGLDVQRAARVMSAAHGGQGLLSQTTANLVEQDLPDDVSLRDLGEHRLKDLGRPRRLFQLVISDLPADFPPLRTLDAYPNNLPVQFTPFIGREQELVAVCDLLRREDMRLLTLTGSGGTGKTRLGLQVAAELSDSFADGTFFVNLAPISDPALVVPTIAETLGIQEGAGQSLLERLRENLRAKRVLLLLDNFEPVVSAAVQVVELLAACPKLKALVTSREVLHVQAEHEFTVPPFPLPDLKHLPDLATLSHNAAIALFIQRAQATKPDFQLTNANARAIVEICARLDGLPLAIELAAARMKLLPPQALLARLGQRLQVLTGAARDVPARQQTLRNTIEWSYNLLDAAEQRLFRRLSVFSGGCTLEAAEAICAAPGDGNEAGQVLDTVASLIDKSLLQQTEQDGEEARFMMLETIREYGLECLAASGEEAVTRLAHAEYYLTLAEAADKEVVGPQQAAWLERLEREHDNLRAALRWLLEQREVSQCTESALRLGSALWRFWQVRGHPSEGRQWLEKALTESRAGMAPVRAQALYAAGMLAIDQGDYDQATRQCEESLALFRELNDRRGMAVSLSVLGYAAQRRGENNTARALLEESLTIGRTLGDRQSIARSLCFLATEADSRGDYIAARAMYEESLAIYRETGDLYNIADVLIAFALEMHHQGEHVMARSLAEEGLELCKKLGNSMGFAYKRGIQLLHFDAFYQGDFTMARSFLEENLRTAKAQGDRAEIATGLMRLGIIALYQGDFVVARSLLEESLVLLRAVGDKRNVAYALGDLGRVALYQGDFVTARAPLEEDLAIAREMGNQRNLSYALGFLGQLALYQGDWTTARSLMEESLAIHRETGDQLGTARRLYDLGRVAFGEGDVRARALYEEALTIFLALKSKWFIAASFEALAAAVLAQGKRTSAARLWGAAESLREGMGAPIPPVERAAYDRSVAAARAQLGEKSFAAAWAEGRSMTPEQALDAKGPVTIPQPLPTVPSSTPPAKSAATYPDGLTAREVEVLRLLARGLTDVQIAEQLVISPRTVNNHLTSIYSKIQVSSRSAATRYAIDHHLI